MLGHWTMPVPRADSGCVTSGRDDDVVSSQVQVSGRVATDECCASAGTTPASGLDDAHVVDVKLDVRYKAEDEDCDLDAACYVCLDASGPMLVNVCACRSTRVHSRCLMELVRHQQPANALHTELKPRCGVCRQELNIDLVAAGIDERSSVCKPARPYDEQCSAWFCGAVS